MKECQRQFNYSSFLLSEYNKILLLSLFSQVASVNTGRFTSLTRQMINYIKGQIGELTPTSCTLETCGVGYELLISLNTYTAIQDRKEAKLYVYEVIREDAYLLYGFSTKQERQLFTLLISVSGVGGQTAKVILSSFSPGELANIIQMENVKLLRGVKGIGPKAAQRIVLDLKDKVIGIEGGTTVQQGVANAVNANAVAEAVSALTTLGFPPAASQKCVSALLQENPNLPIEQVIKQALKLL